MEHFENLLGKENPLLETIKIRGFKVPTEIQEKSIPDILKGKDVIAGAATGSGKTLAFAAGLINNIKKGFRIQGLVLTPTRELAEQITNELSEFSKNENLNVISVYGGVSINEQIRKLNSAEIVVGTPGRILDHINRNTINLTLINTLVIDEADRMFDMGFQEDVEKIISECPGKRQTMLFSATITSDVVHLAQKHMSQPKEILAEQYVDPTKLEQIYYDIDNNIKYSLLKHLLENEQSKLVMIFCNTRKNVDFVAKNLRFMGINTLPIHGGFSQEKRNRMIEDFHSRKVYILVATDVAARGLDIKGVSHIYNYDIPPTKKEYIHRIGRTARAGKEGKVINLLTSRDYENFQNINDGEFKISQENAPFVKRVMIRWMPERKNERMQRRQFGQGRFGGRDDKRKDIRTNERSYGIFGGRTNERFSGRSYGRTNTRMHRTNERTNRRFGGRRQFRQNNKQFRRF